MPYNSSLDVTINPAQEASIIADINDAKNTLNAIATVTLSKEESDVLNGVDNIRLPFVQRTVMEFGPAYPSLVSRRITALRANNLFQTFIALRNIETHIKELADRAKDLSTNAEHLLYDYTTDMYNDSGRMRGDLEGAEVVYEYLKQLYAGQGPQNPPAPPLP